MKDIEIIIAKLKYSVFKNANVVLEFYLSQCIKDGRMLYHLRQMVNEGATSKEVVARLNQNFDSIIDLFIAYYSALIYKNKARIFEDELKNHVKYHLKLDVTTGDLDVFLETLTEVIGLQGEILELWSMHLSIFKGLFWKEFQRQQGGK